MVAIRTRALGTGAAALIVLAVVMFYSMSFALRGLDVGSCKRQQVPRTVQRDFLHSDAQFQRRVADLAGENGRANAARRAVAARWDRDAARLVVPKCDSHEIPYPWPF